MKVIPEMLEFFFWIYIFEVKCLEGVRKKNKKNRKRVLDSYSDFIDEATRLFHQVVVEKCLEGFVSFGGSSISLKREFGQIIFRIELRNEKEARTYMRALKRYRDRGCDISDYVSLTEPNFMETKWILKCKDLTWQATQSTERPAVEIKIKDG